jgi:hypothetical protein
VPDKSYQHRRLVPSSQRFGAWLECASCVRLPRGSSASSKLLGTGCNSGTRQGQHRACVSSLFERVSGPSVACQGSFRVNFSFTSAGTKLPVRTYWANRFGLIGAELRSAALLCPSSTGLACPVGQSRANQRAICLAVSKNARPWTKTVLSISSNDSPVFTILHMQFGQKELSSHFRGPHPRPS